MPKPRGSSTGPQEGQLQPRLCCGCHPHEEPPSQHLCRQGQLLVTERGYEESQGILLFLSHSVTSLIDAWGMFLQNTPPCSRGRRLTPHGQNPGKEVKNFPSYRKWTVIENHSKIISDLLAKL